MSNTEELRKQLYQEGEKMRRKVLGDAHVDRCKQVIVIHIMNYTNAYNEKQQTRISRISPVQDRSSPLMRHG